MTDEQAKTQCSCSCCCTPDGGKAIATILRSLADGIEKAIKP